jgi:chemotaxis protein CheD
MFPSRAEVNVRDFGTEIVVGVGDCRVAAAPAGSIVTYALGSCVAIVAYDWKSKVGGLLHAMLPDSAMDPARAGNDPFLYVDSGIAELFRRLECKGASLRRTKCCVAGGAAMMADAAQFETGRRNYLAVKKAFWKLGIFIEREDIGGSETRTIRLDLTTGQIDLRKGGGPGRIFVPPGFSLTGMNVQADSEGRL